MPRLPLVALAELDGNVRVPPLNASSRNSRRRGPRGESVAGHARLALRRRLRAARQAATAQALVTADREIVGKHRLDADDLLDTEVVQRGRNHVICYCFPFSYVDRRNLRCSSLVRTPNCAARFMV
jgi:hypothetical protein